MVRYTVAGSIVPQAEAGHIVPLIVAQAGDTAAWRYIDFFAANVRNPNTRRAYARGCGQFLAWCNDRALMLTTIRTFDISAYIEALQAANSAPGVKQQLAAVRVVFDWLIAGRVVPINPTSAGRGPKHVVRTGRTPVLDSTEWLRLVDAIPLRLLVTSLTAL